MSYRDDEIKRLESYCRGLGIKIRYKTKTKENPEAEWDLDTNEITIYKSIKLTKVQLILNIIHELGHHFDFVYNNRKTKDRIDRAWYKENEGIPMEKTQRKHIYLDEQNASRYRESVIKEVNLNIPKNLLKFDIAMDLYVYKYFYLKGFYPTNKEYNLKRKEYIKKYKLKGKK